MTPRFRELEQAVVAQRVEADVAATEPDPELVVVFDLVGTVADLARAVEKIPGLEFLAELDEGQAESDDDFYVEKSGERTTDQLDETAYLVVTNTRAVTQLISLFRAWQANENAPFPWGLAPLRNAFRLLRDIRRWGPEDRIRDTGLLERWREDVAVVGNSGSVRVEVELLFRTDPSRRDAAQAQVEALVRAAGGEVQRAAVLPQIGYHALLVQLPYPQVEMVLAQGPGAIELLMASDVMLVSPAQTMSVLRPDETAAIGDTPLPTIDRPEEAPVVALLDAVPLANHDLLTNRLVLDDPDGLGARYPTASQQRHGTAMASLIAHGDLNDAAPPLPSRIYVRPVLGPHPYYPNVECLPEGELLVDLLHRAFQRMFDGEDKQPPAAPSVRVINLSLGDPGRVFVRRLSPLARLLDWLAYHYNVVILVSAGNHDLPTTVPAEALNDPAELSRHILTDSRDNALLRRLFSPAEAVNVLTVGATHADSWTGDIPGTVLDAVQPNFPSPYAGAGSGYRRAVKPDMLLPGGRRVYLKPPPGLTGKVPLAWAETAATGPGQRVAAPDTRGGASATAYSHGTSNATALGSRASAVVMRLLARERPEEGDDPFPDQQYHPVLTKALLVHATSWGQSLATLRAQLDPGLTRNHAAQLLGYGELDLDRLAVASRGRATLLGAGTISDEQRHTYRFPLPAGLRATTDWRRLTITLAWLSPITSRAQLHRTARLWVDPPHADLKLGRTDVEHHAVRRGTVQHELLEGEKATVFADNAHLTLNVDCRLDKPTAPNLPVRYALVVSLEVGLNVQTDVHAEVRQQLRARAQTIARVRPNT